MRHLTHPTKILGAWVYWHFCWLVGRIRYLWNIYIYIQKKYHGSYRILIGSHYGKAMLRGPSIANTRSRWILNLGCYNLRTHPDGNEGNRGWIMISSGQIETHMSITAEPDRQSSGSPVGVIQTLISWEFPSHFRVNINKNQVSQLGKSANALTFNPYHSASYKHGAIHITQLQ